MSLSNYVSASSGLYLELKECLTKEDIVALKSELSTMGFHQYYKWFHEHQYEIGLFVAETPSVRKKKKIYQDPQMRRLLLFAGMQLCKMAHILLAAVHDNNIEPGSSYRDMATTAGKASYECFVESSKLWCQSYWPFEGDSPFA